MQIRVVILASYPTVLYGLRAAVEGDSSIEVVGTATSYEALIDMLSLEPVDVVLADIDWDEEGRDDAVESLELAPLLLFTDRLEEVPDALRSGVRGVLLRDSDAETLVAALHAIANDLVVYDARAAIFGAEREAGMPDQIAHEPLTSREVEVLQLIARGLPNKGIALELGISEHTVKFHVGSILTKFGAASRSEALAHAMAAGLVTV